MAWARVNEVRRRRATVGVVIGCVLLHLPQTTARPLSPVVTVRDLPLPSVLSSPALAQAQTVCSEVGDPGVVLLALPQRPTAGSPVAIVALSPRGVSDSIVEVRAVGGDIVHPYRLERLGMSQRAVVLSFASLDVGSYIATVRSADRVSTFACIDFSVSESPASSEAAFSSVWPVQRDWSPAMEELYSAWIAKLFYVTPGAHKGWQPLHQATRDPTRNFLYGTLGLDEDNGESAHPVRLMPDCADLPYHLRAYFSWKLGLPMLINLCNRGRADTGSHCIGTLGNTTEKFDSVKGLVERFNAFVDQWLTWQVQTGNLRTAPSQTLSDTYSVTVSREALRPGAVFVDPGGHTLVVSQVEPQRESGLGVLYGVDAHPDRTITHKSFGPGTFVFNHRVPTGGFKAFRPVVRDASGGLRFLTNEEIDVREDFSPRAEPALSFESDEAFYDNVFTLLNPLAPEPRDVLFAKIEVLHAAMLDRVQAVQLGEEYMGEQGGAAMPMPRGAEIFETVGPWETYSTPARDMRVLLAIDDVMRFPKAVAAHLDRYAISQDTVPGQIEAQLSGLRDKWLGERFIEYQRSDGSFFQLSLLQIVARQAELEMAYNPNDCPEIRWGAPKGSDELSTCVRLAPAEQRFRMKMARAWFAKRHRPDQR